MTTSSVPEPPILADTEKARNCLGLNATVLPGLGTFRHGARLRGLLEMAVAIGGTLWFCKTLFVVAGEIFGVAQFRAETESAAHLSSGISVWRIHGPVFLLSAATVIVSWISGVRYGRAAVKGKQG
jgi:hypothetical protein